MSAMSAIFYDPHRQLPPVFRSWLFSASLRLRGELLIFRSRAMSAITCDSGDLLPPPLPPMFTQFHPRSPNLTQASGRGSQPDLPITCDHPITPFLLPHTRNFQLLLQTNGLHESILGPPLRHAWVALGWPLRGPWATQSQTQSPAEKHRQRVTTHKAQNATEIPLRHSQFQTYSCGTGTLACDFSRTVGPGSPTGPLLACLG